MTKERRGPGPWARSYLIYLALVLPVVLASQFAIRPHSRAAALIVDFAAILGAMWAKDRLQRRLWPVHREER